MNTLVLAGALALGISASDGPLAALHIDYARVGEKVGRDYLFVLDFDCKSARGQETQFWVVVVPYSLDAHSGAFRSQRVSPFFDATAAMGCSVTAYKTPRTTDRVEIGNRRELFAAACGGTLASSGDVLGPCLGARRLQMPLEQFAQENSALLFPLKMSRAKSSGEVKIELPASRRPVNGIEKWIGVRLTSISKTVPNVLAELGKPEAVAMHSVVSALTTSSAGGADPNEIDKAMQLLRFAMPSKEIVSLPDAFFSNVQVLKDALGKIHRGNTVRGADVLLAAKNLREATLALIEIQESATIYLDGFEDIQAGYCSAIWSAYDLLLSACASGLPDTAVLLRVCGRRASGASCRPNIVQELDVPKSIVASFRYGLGQTSPGRFFEAASRELQMAFPDAQITSIDRGFRIEFAVPNALDCSAGGGSLRAVCEERVRGISYRVISRDGLWDIEESWVVLVGSASGGFLDIVSRGSDGAGVLDSIAVFPKTSVFAQRTVTAIRNALFKARVSAHASEFPIDETKCPGECVSCAQFDDARNLLRERVIKLRSVTPPSAKPCAEDWGQAEVDLETAVRDVSNAYQIFEALRGSVGARCRTDGG